MLDEEVPLGGYSVNLWTGLRTMFSHIFTSVTVFEKSLKFNEAIMTALDLEQRFCDFSIPWAGCHSGGMSEGEPELRQQYHANYYGAYFRDLEGNKIGVASHTQ